MSENNDAPATRQDLAELRKFFERREDRIIAAGRAREDRIVETMRDIETRFVKQFMHFAKAMTNVII
jgi:hypothetical protein